MCAEIDPTNIGYIPYDELKTRIVNREVQKLRDSDETELLKIVEKIISDEPQAVEQAKSNIQTINYLVGKVMQATKGKADPTLTLNLLKKQIGI